MEFFHQGMHASSAITGAFLDDSRYTQSLASMTGDLSSMTAPPFILSPTSLTEFPAYWGERPELFAEISQGRDEADRAERVLRWFICTLKGQYTVSLEYFTSE
jgi:hypothetical protein